MKSSFFGKGINQIAQSKGFFNYDDGDPVNSLNELSSDQANTTIQQLLL